MIEKFDVNIELMSHCVIIGFNINKANLQLKCTLGWDLLAQGVWARLPLQVDNMEAAVILNICFTKIYGKVGCRKIIKEV